MFTWYQSVANCSAASFQLPSSTHLWTPPMTSVPSSSWSSIASMYQAMSPSDSRNGTGAGFQVAKMSPL